MALIDNYNKIKEKIHDTALQCGRNPDEIKILSVSKTFSTEIIQNAIDSGITLFGENKIQEANQKFNNIKGSFELHMIGHLQSNKINDALDLFEVIHSIDKATTALKLNSAAETKDKIQRIFLQLKTTEEVTKYGASLSELLSITEIIINLKNLKLEGLMSIGPNTTDTTQIQKSFIETAKALDILNNKFNLNLTELSMGMSGDYPIAVKEGATIVRVGSAIFGNRYYYK